MSEVSPSLRTCRCASILASPHVPAVRWAHTSSSCVTTYSLHAPTQSLRHNYNTNHNTHSIVILISTHTEQETHHRNHHSSTAPRSRLLPAQHSQQSRPLFSPGLTQPLPSSAKTMAEHAQGNVHNQPAPGPRFLSLPDVVQANIATFLPDGNKMQKDSRLRISDAPRALVKRYGGSLTRLAFRHVEGSSVARLGALLQRQQNRYEVVVKKHAVIPAICQAILNGCCHRVERLYISADVTDGGLHLLL